MKQLHLWVLNCVTFQGECCAVINIFIDNTIYSLHNKMSNISWNIYHCWQCRNERSKEPLTQESAPSAHIPL